MVPLKLFLRYLLRFYDFGLLNELVDQLMTRRFVVNILDSDLCQVYLHGLSVKSC
jgi:hypothetical protein